ncbi:MAG: RHS repeat-associated core domain-containing protein [Luteolibacter sp.]|uniref:RHS repeat domain-containing protein n=1 Tax=Luteolibacter sp. TaxID=1962973 RepID=UPI003262D340
MNYKSIASVLILALAPLLSTYATCPDPSCGTDSTIRVGFKGEGSTNYTENDKPITVTMSVGGKPATGTKPMGVSVVTDTPSEPYFEMKPEIVYGGSIDLMVSGTAAGCAGNQVKATFAPEHACGWTLRISTKDPITNKWSSWVESAGCVGGAAVAESYGTFRMNFQLQLVRKADDNQAQGNDGEANDGGGGAGAIAGGGSTPPSIPPDFQGVAPAPSSQVPQQTSPAGFHFSLPLGSNSASQGYNIGSLALEGPISPLLVDMGNMVFNNPGMPGVQVGKVTDILQVHFFDPVLVPCVGSSYASGLYDDPSITLSDSQEVEHKNQLLAQSNVGTLADVRPINGSIVVRFFKQGDFDPGVTTPGGDVIHEIKLNAVPTKTVVFSPVFAAGDHAGGIRVTTTAPNQVIRTTDYLNLLTANSWRVSKITGTTAIESTDFISNFEYDSDESRWQRTDIATVTRDGVLYAKSTKTSIYQVKFGPNGAFSSYLFPIEEVVYDTAGHGLTTTWEPDPDFLGRPKSVIRPDGSWEAYTYYTGSESVRAEPWKGFLKETLRPWNGNSAVPASASSSNSESTLVKQYEAFVTSAFLNGGYQPAETIITRPCTGSSSPVQLSQSLWSPGSGLSIMLNQLEDAGLNSHWRPDAGAIRQGSSGVGGLSSSSFTYLWSPDRGAPWVGTSLGQFDDVGNGTATGYERGHYVSTGPGTYTFTANNPQLLDVNNPWGNDIRSVTVNLIGNHAPADSEATREVVIRNSRGIPYLKEFSIKDEQGSIEGEHGNWTVVTTTTYTYPEFWPDGSVKEVIVQQDGRTIARSRVDASGYGFLATSWDEQGIQTSNLFDAISRPRLTTRFGVSAQGGNDAQPDILTAYTPIGRKTTTVVSAGGSSRTSEITEDLAGRTISEQNDLGAVTITSYPPNGNGRDTSIQLPGGSPADPGRYIARNIDGRVVSITGWSVVSEFYVYDMLANGNMTVTKSLGAADSERYTVTETDSAGRTVKVTKPSPTGTGEVTTSYGYSSTGIGSITQPTGGGSSTLLIERPFTGSLTTYTGYNLEGSGLDPYGTVQVSDRVSESSNYYVVEGGEGWAVSVRKNYDVNGAGSETDGITRITKRRLKANLNGTASQTISIAPGGLTLTTTTVIDQGSKSVVATEVSNASTTNAVSVNVIGLVVSQSAHNGVKPTRWKYNGLGQPVRETSPRGAVSQKGYNANGLLWTTTDHANKTTNYSYYASNTRSAGRLFTVTNPSVVATDPTGTTTTYAYSDLGKVAEVAGTAAYKVSYHYDAYGAMDTMTTYGAGSASQTTEWVYQPGSGLLSSKKDAAQKHVDYEYYASGKLAKRTWARGGSATYSYTNYGDLTGIDYSDTDTPDVLLEDLDRLGRPTTIKQAGVVVEKLTYNAKKGTLKERYNASTHPLLPDVGVSYDPSDSAGRSVGVKETSGPAPTATTIRTVGYTYDPASGNLQTITDDTTQNHVYTYYPNSSLISTINSRSGTSSWFQETRYYDIPGRLTGIRSDRMASPVVPISSYSYGYDALNRRTKNTFQDGSFAEYAYREPGETIDRSEIRHVTRKNAAGASIPQLDTSYTYDGTGNRLTSNSAVLGNHTYTPNSLNQYASITTAGSRTAIGRAPLDPYKVVVNGGEASRNGEIYWRDITATNTTNPVWKSIVTKHDTDQLDPAANFFWYAKTPTVPVYDADGNLTDDGRWKYSWDAENRLIQMETTNAATTNAGHPYTKLKFVYDWQGRRIGRTVWKGSNTDPFSNHRWLYDGWNVIAEFSGTTTSTSNVYAETGGTPQRLNTFTWGIDLSGTFRGTGGVGGLLVQTDVTAANLLGTQRASYDGDGNIVAWTKSNATAPTSRREYDAFGNTLVSEGTVPCSFGFSTKMQDLETGLYYYGYRYYDPTQGRWSSRDPLGESDGCNINAFVRNAPCNAVDILGLSSIYGLSPAMAMELGVTQEQVFVTALAIGSVLDVPRPVSAPPEIEPIPEPEPEIKPETKPEPKPVPPLNPPDRPKKEECNGCKSCKPPERDYVYQIAKGVDRSNGRHAPNVNNPNGIDQVKYWLMTQVPFSETNPKACQCYLRFSHSDDNTLVPMPGPHYHPGAAGPDVPPPAFEGPSLGGGKIIP